MDATTRNEPRWKILVTGATGHVGKPLVKFLRDKGVPIRILVRDRRKAGDLGPNVQVREGDLDKPETLASAVHGIERLFLVTGNTQQVINLLDAANRAGVKRIVKQSTIEAGRSLGPGKWHREQEELIKACGFAWTFCRPTMMMVNAVDWWANTIKTQGRVYFPGGRNGRVAPIDPQDVAAVTCAVLTEPGHEGKIYELTGPESLTIAEMVETIGRAIGKPVRYVNIPASLAVWWLRRFGHSEQLVKGLMETLRSLRKQEYAYVTSTVAAITGNAPHSFAAWCVENITAFQ